MPRPIGSTIFLVPIGTAAPCRRREPPVLVPSASAASGMRAAAQSFIEPQVAEPYRGCGSIELSGVVNLLLAACALALENRRLTPPAEDVSSLSGLRQLLSKLFI